MVLEASDTNAAKRLGACRNLRQRKERRFGPQTPVKRPRKVPRWHLACLFPHPVITCLSSLMRVASPSWEARLIHTQASTPHPRRPPRLSSSSPCGPSSFSSTPSSSTSPFSSLPRSCFPWHRTSLLPPLRP